MMYAKVVLRSGLMDSLLVVSTKKKKIEGCGDASLIADPYRLSTKKRQ